MPRRLELVAAALAALVAPSIVACGDDVAGVDAGALDAGLDGASADAGRDGATIEPTPPAPPVLTPCPAGWQEREVDGVARCDPWPGGVPLDCPVGEMQLPGSSACEPVGSPCAVDGWPTGLPPAVPVIYVRAGASGGDGTRALPYGDIRSALDAAPDGTIVAIAPGLYEESALVRTSVTLWGACTDTIVTALPISISIAADDVTIRNLTVGGSTAMSVRATRAHIEDVVFSDLAESAVSMIAGGDISIAHVSVRGTGSSAFLVSGPATVDLRRAEIRDVGDSPFSFSRVQAVVEDVAIRGLTGATTLPGAILASASTDLSLERFVIDEATTTSVYVLDASHVSATDCFVRSSATAANGEPGWAVIDGSSLEIERAVFIRPTFEVAVGVGVVTLSIRDVVVEDVVVDPMLGRGEGFEITEGAHLAAERVSITGATGFGIFASDNGTTLDATDLYIARMRAAPDGLLGRALQVQNGAAATIERLEIVEAREAAVVAAGLSTSAMLTNVSVSRTAEASCEGACASAGVGFGAYLRGHITARRFLVDESALVGMQLALTGEMDLEDGVVARSPVGINVQAPGYDLGRLMRNVAFVDNGANLDSSELPVPSLGGT